MTPQPSARPTLGAGQRPVTLVYRSVGRSIEQCAYGGDHEITYVEIKRITPTGQTRVHDNGYEKNLTPLFVDAQGRTYHRHEAVDYFNNIGYLRDEDRQGYSPLHSLSTTIGARDLSGRPIIHPRTGKPTCPPGPAWSRELAAETEAQRRSRRR